MASIRAPLRLMFRVKHKILKNQRNGMNGNNHVSGQIWVIISSLAATSAFGVFVITGQVTTSVSGPAVVPSLLIAAVASLLAGLCIAEFVTSQPQMTVSLYSSCYYSIGEVVAFLIGWMTLLYHMSALATVCRTQSATMDYIMGHQIQKAITKTFGQVAYLHAVPDFLAVGLLLVTSLLLIFGLQQSKWAGLVLLVTTISATLFFLVSGSLYSDSRNWTHGTGFLSRGPSGLLSGAAICVNAFVGPHLIAGLGASTQRPHRCIPLTIGLSSTLSFLICFGVAIVLSLLVRHDELRTTVPIIEAFQTRDLRSSEFVMAGCTLVSLAILALEMSFPIHETAVLMSSDGLIFQILAKTWKMTGTPAICILLFCCLTSLLVLLLDTMDLLKITAALSLVVNTVISLVVLLRRYQPPGSCHYHLVINDTSSGKHNVHEGKPKCKKTNITKPKLVASESCQLIFEDNSLWLPPNTSDTSSNELESTSEDSSETDVDAIVDEYREKLRVAALTHIDGPSTSHLIQEPTLVTWRRVVFAVSGLVGGFIILSFLLTLGSENLETAQPFWLIIATIVTIVIGSMMIIVARQPHTGSTTLGQTRFAFHVPLLPWIPALAIFINMCLFIELLEHTWIPLLVWIAAGFCVYFLYGIHSSLAATPSESLSPFSQQQQISLQPLPQHDKECVPHIVPSHRQNNSRFAEIDTVLIRH